MGPRLYEHVLIDGCVFLGLGTLGLVCSVAKTSAGVPGSAQCLLYVANFLCSRYGWYR